MIESGMKGVEVILPQERANPIPFLG